MKHDPLCPWPDRTPGEHCLFCHSLKKAAERERDRIYATLADQGYVPASMIAEDRERIAKALEVYDFIDGDKAAQIARGG